MTNIRLGEAEVDRFNIISEVNSRKLTQREASEMLGITTRQVHRLLIRVRSEGIAGIKSKHRGGNRLFSPEFKERILTAVRERYQGFGPTFASEKLQSLEGLKISKETLRQWMMSSGLWNGRSRKRARIHQSRERRPRFGELVQIDGSHHDWFEGRSPKCCLLVFVDDATSQIIGLRFDETETTLGYMALVQEHLKTYGRPVAYYSDKHSIFKTTREHSIDSRFEPTQLHRALRALQIELICAHSSQAKGRVERANQTLQDRLVKEMRLRGISNIDDANAYAPEFIMGYNKQFGVAPANEQDAHRVVVSESATLKRVLSVQIERKLSKNLEFSLDCRTYQIITTTKGYRLRHKTVTICRHIDGTESVVADNKPLEFKTLESKTSVLTTDTKELNSVVDRILSTGFLSVNQSKPVATA